jgi:hypothetical protein
MMFNEFLQGNGSIQVEAAGHKLVCPVHGTPGYPLTAVVGLTFRLRGK